MTRQLWAPWRLAYVQQADEQDGCVFCRAAGGEPEDEGLVVHRGAQAFVLLNRFPYSSGHLMVAPARHTAELGDLDPAESAEIHDLTVAPWRRSEPSMRPMRSTSAGTSAPSPEARSPDTCTSMSYRVGAVTRTSCRCWRTSRCCPSTWRSPASVWRRPGRDPRAGGEPERPSTHVSGAGAPDGRTGPLGHLPRKRHRCAQRHRPARAPRRGRGRACGGRGPRPLARARPCGSGMGARRVVYAGRSGAQAREARPPCRRARTGSGGDGSPGPLMEGPCEGTYARRVTSVDELVAARRIQHESFGEDPAQVSVEEARADFDVEGVVGSTFLAFVDERPAAAGYASYTPLGLLLFGGATLPSLRGRGAYRALVAARAREAAQRGTPVLVTHAGQMSRPILERLGFEPLARIDRLLDVLDGIARMLYPRRANQPAHGYEPSRSASAAHPRGPVVCQSYRLQPLTVPSSLTASANARNSSAFMRFATPPAA